MEQKTGTRRPTVVDGPISALPLICELGCFDTKTLAQESALCCPLTDKAPGRGGDTLSEAEFLFLSNESSKLCSAPSNAPLNDVGLTPAFSPVIPRKRSGVVLNP